VTLVGMIADPRRGQRSSRRGPEGQRSSRVDDRQPRCGRHV